MIAFHSEGIDIKTLNLKRVSDWLSQTIRKEQKEIGNLNFVFSSDEYLLSMNQEYLNHDTYTDVITFNYVENNLISGDIFISAERVKENALLYSSNFTDELHRVIVHGVLHLIGYNDKTDREAQEIRAKEDFYLTLRP